MCEADSRTKILYHGTGSRRLESIKNRGLLPKLDSFVYASEVRKITCVFATARGELEDDWGLIVKFKTEKEGWVRDPQFPDSLKSVDAVKPEDILDFEILDLEEELQCSEWLKAKVKTIFLT
ncbi:MAG: hypothetical protein JSV12_03730 [Candidatus Bathyarchaeota archaeon]|nr:MAG: hypothetical protein JSV12_03730 [Candidatus Bathyarchaeota archaeon]